MTKTISLPFSVLISTPVVNEFPVWRTGMPLNQFSPIPGTDRLQGYEWPQPWTVPPGQTRTAKYIISGYSGLVRAGMKFYAMANAGHDGWQNVVIAADMSQSPPQWIVESPCSDFVQAQVSISGQYSGPYFADGKPVGAQNYWDCFHISATHDRNGVSRIMRFGDLYPFMAVSNAAGGAYSGGNSVKGFRTAVQLWDSEVELVNGQVVGSTWADLPAFLGNPTLQSPPLSMCQHPTTEVVYMLNANSIHYWLPSTGVAYLAVDYSPSRGTSKYSGGLSEWESFVSLVDINTTRSANGRLVCVVSDAVSPFGVPSLQYVDLPSTPTGTYAVGNIQLTGDALPDNCRSMGCAYDCDNDVYIFVTGGVGGYHVFAITPTGNVSLRQVVAYVEEASTTGIFGRIAYWPELNGIVMVPEYAGSIMFMRTR